MVIRDEQIEVFAKAFSERFKEQATQHLKSCFPEECERIGDEGVRHLIELGVRRAKRWGLESGRHVCRYLDLMVVLGPYFDQDPRLPWLRRLLGAQSVDVDERMDRVHVAVLQLLDQLSHAT